MTAYGSATVLRVEDGNGGHIPVVTAADDVVGITYEALDEIQRAVPEPLDPDVFGIGTPGHGLGRLWYRVVERDDVTRWAIARRIA